jgi:hypothetical protein
MIIQILVLALYVLGIANAIGQKRTISSFSTGEKDLPLANDKIEGEIVLDGQEFWGVIRAAGDLVDDFERVTGKRSMRLTISNSTANTGLYKYYTPADKVRGL